MASEVTKLVESLTIEKKDLKSIVFFVENEFKVRPKVTVIETSKGFVVDTGNYYSTINAVLIDHNGGMKVFKVDAQFTQDALTTDENVSYFQRAKEYIEKNFVEENLLTTNFVGCVRDQNFSHKKITLEKLKMICRNDPYHDIANIAKNIIENQATISYRVNDVTIFIQWSDLNTFSKFGFNYGENNFAEDHAKAMRFLYENNFFEQMLNMYRDKPNLNAMANFFLLMKKLLELLEKSFDDSVCENFRDVADELEKYSGTADIVNSIRGFIALYEEHKIPFKANHFSTQMIEAEKGYLRYHACPKKARKKQSASSGQRTPLLVTLTFLDRQDLECVQ